MSKHNIACKVFYTVVCKNVHNMLFRFRRRSNRQGCTVRTAKWISLLLFLKTILHKADRKIWCYITYLDKFDFCWKKAYYLLRKKKNGYIPKVLNNGLLAVSLLEKHTDVLIQGVQRNLQIYVLFIHSKNVFG